MAAERPVRWSHARARLLRECPRAFFLRYLSRGPERAHLRALGELGTLPMLAGVAVDLVAAHAVARPGQTDLAHYGARLYRRMVEAGSSAAEGAARDGLLPPRLQPPFRPLLHTYFGLDIGHEYVQGLEERVVEALRRLEASDTLRRLRTRHPAQVRLGTLEGPPPCVRLEGAELITSPDVLEIGDRILILDFKTGFASPMARVAAMAQLRLYALAEWSRTGVASSQIETQAIWLSDECEEPPSPLSVDGVAAALNELREGLRDLSQRLEAAPGGETSLAAFEPKPTTRRCTWCPYRPLCSEGSEVTAHLLP